MFLRRCTRKKDGKQHHYWALVESVRTARGSRQRVVAYIGNLDEAARQGVQQTAEGRGREYQGCLFDEVQPEWIEVDAKAVRVERSRDFGAAWLGVELLHQLQLPEQLEQLLEPGAEDIPWAVMAQVLILMRLVNPSSELAIAEGGFAKTALADLLGVPADKINDDRLYRALDALLPHKAALEKHLKERLGTLFDLQYDLLLYDITSTYFEGAATGNTLAARGYSRDHRPDCKQVCIGLVVSRCGLPLGYEIFAGNRSDVTTVEEIVEAMEQRYGKADRIWVMDRGMVSQDNIEFLAKEGRRYIVGTPKSMLHKFEQQLLEKDWQTIRDGLEVKLCPGPEGDETFILCRSADRREKEKAMHARFVQRIEQGLTSMAAQCLKKNYKPGTIERKVGKLLGANTRAAGSFDVEVTTSDAGGARLTWTVKEAQETWASLSEGCYLLRSNVRDWSAEELWKAYIQLTEVEAAFRICKQNLEIRPVWHQKTERVEAHILVCFLAYVLWKTLGQLCRQAGLGDEPRKVLETLGEIKSVDVVLPTKKGVEIRKRCITRPDPHQEVLLQKLRLKLPAHIKMQDV